MKVAVTAFLSLAFAIPVFAQAPVSDISAPSSQRRASVSGGVAVDDGAAAQTYGAGGYDTGTAVESSPRQAVTSDNRGTSSSYAGAGAESGGLYRQFQQLQEEVASLRGQLEEQSHELQKLKQQQQDDFANLDRRVSGGSSAGASSTASEGAGNAVASKATSSAQSSVTNSEGRDDYESAYAKLKTKDYDGAASAFKALTNKYPNSEYAGNSWFWLGFIYQTKGDVDNAAKAFSSLIERFPDHAKTDDAKYNLGKIYHQQGKTEKARTLLKEVAAGSSKSAPLAKSYLQSM